MPYIGYTGGVSIIEEPSHRWFATVLDGNELDPVYPFQLKQLKIKILKMRGLLGPRWISWQILV